MISILISIFLSSLRLGWNIIKIAYLHMRKLFLKGLFKVLKVFFIVSDHVLSWLIFVWGLTPWCDAYIYAAFEMYTKTPLYRDRITTFNQEFAISSYLGEGGAIGEKGFFKSKVRKDKKLMLRIIFAPYSLRPTEVLI